MEKENKKILKKIYGQNKSLRNTVIVTLVLTILFFSLFIIIDSRQLPNSQNIEKVKSSGEYVEGNIYGITECFATFTEEDVVKDEYYIAVGESSLYIINLSKSQYSDIIAKMDNVENIKINGISEIVPKDLKELAIDTYNQVYEDEKITDFNEAYTTYMLNAKRGPNDSAQIFLVFGILSFICFVVILICYIIILAVTNKNIKNIIKNYDIAKIMEELKSPSKKEFKITKAIFLDTYLISYSNSLEIIKYTDMVWIYPHEQRINGINSINRIMLVTKDKKKHMIATVSAMGSNSKEEYNNTYGEIISRKPNILQGYTNENITAMSKANIDTTIATICND